MKRYGIIIVILFIFILFTALMAGAGTPKKVENSKHNMSSNPFAEQGTIKSAASGGTTEICVFCHTPHGGNTEAPLWNRALYSSTPSGYTPYTSDVLSALSYSSAEDPYISSGTGVIHARTRICLSCHDGTIAIGRLVNLPTSFGTADPNTTLIAMQGTSGGFMPPTSAGNIGVDLRDDHPVAIKHNPGSGAGYDAELKAIDTTTKVRVYNIYAGQVKATQTSGDYVECTSCHDAHDNQYGKFLIDDNAGSKLCRSCHSKTGYSSIAAGESAHYNATNLGTQAYAPTTGGIPANLGTTVGDVQCMACHYPHRAGIQIGDFTAVPSSGKYLLTYREEKSCFNNTNRWGQVTLVCHGSNASNVNINIENAENFAATRHDTQNAGRVERHGATEAQSPGWINSPGSLDKWHVECQDCHNPHSAGQTLHTSPTNAVISTSPLYGTGGVTAPSVYATWSLVPTQSTWPGGAYIEPIGVVNTLNPGVANEYQICFKCHTDFAWGTGTIPDSPSLGAGNKMTNQAMELNPGNQGRHPVVAATGRNKGQLIGWGAIGTNLMYCSDCHTKQEASPRPQGPHGSSQTHILRRAFDDSYGSRGSQANQLQTDLCFACHDWNVYGLAQQTRLVQGAQANETGFYETATSNNLHTRHVWNATNANPLFATRNPYSFKCVNCHTRITHGLNEKAMVLAQNNANVPGIYSGLASGVSGTYKLLSYVSSGSGYSQANCANVSGCHQN